MNSLLPAQLYGLSKNHLYVLAILKNKFGNRKVRQQPEELWRLAEHLQSYESKKAAYTFVGEKNMAEAILAIKGE